MDKMPDSQDAIIVYSTTWCPDCKRAKKFLGEQRVPYHNIDIESDPQRAGSTKQAASAAGEGATAALMMREYLTEVG